MKHLVLLLIIILLISPWLANAESTKVLRYQGQSCDHMSLDSITTETQYRDEVRYQTCTRQVPYQEQICQQVPRVRQECHQAPPQTQCHMEGGGVVCTFENGRRVCRNEPPRQVCNSMPGQTICNNVTYYENVCRYETRYRTESYSCPVTVRVPYTVNVTRYAEIDFQFENAMGMVNADLRANFDSSGMIQLTAQDYSNQALIVARKDYYNSDEGTYSNKTTRARYTISFLPKERVLNPLRMAPDQIQMAASELRFVMNKSFAPQQLLVTLTFQGQGVMENRTVSADQLFIRDLNPMQSLVTINFQQLNLYLPYGAYNVTVDLRLNLGGDILNINEQTYQSRTVYLPMTGM